MTIVDKIKAQLKVLMGSETKVEFKTAKLEDGSAFDYDAEELVEGTDVFTLAEDGTQTPLADGEYTLEDGTKLHVKEGKVSAAPEAEAEVEVAEEVAQEEVAVEETVTEEVVDEVAGRLENLEAAVQAILEKLNSMEMSKEKHSKKPSPAIKHSKVEVAAEGTVNVKNEMERIRQMADRLK